jgi:hypothetical protein
MNDIENQNQTHTLLLTRKWLYNKKGIETKRMAYCETRECERDKKWEYEK